MQCNIDQRGRRVRRNWGILNLLAALGLGGLAAVNHWWWAWVVGGLCAAGGLFALFEARKGWCAVRAMGIKTRV